MIVSEILSPDAILTSINASSKKRVLQEISIAVQNFYGLNQSEVFLALQEREDLVLPEWGMELPYHMQE